MDLTDVTYFSILSLPHVSMVLAWVFWSLQIRQLALPKWRGILLLLALLAGTLNIAVFWTYVAWLHRHYTTESWKGADFAFRLCEPLIALTIVGALFGRGRTRVVLCLAGVLGFLLWATTSIGV